MPGSNNPIQSAMVKDYLARFSDLPSATLARKMYNENRAMFLSQETARRSIRYYRGATGKRLLGEMATTDFLPPAKAAEKFNLPSSYEIPYEPFFIVAQKMLILSDIHIPYHNMAALEIALDFAVRSHRRKPYDAILLNGDILDCHQLSHFVREPNKRSFAQELEAGKKLLKELARLFKCRIYWKMGNHEERYQKFLMQKAAELLDIKEFRIDVLLDMFNLKCEMIDMKRVIRFDKLNIVHGHEFPSSMTGPVNAARGLFLRSKGNTVCGHYHQTSEHSESTINGDLITCWSIGCLSELHPQYAPINKWNHGFMEVEMVDDGKFNVSNYRIINGKVYGGAQ